MSVSLIFYARRRGLRFYLLRLLQELNVKSVSLDRCVALVVPRVFAFVSSFDAVTCVSFRTCVANATDHYYAWNDSVQVFAAFYAIYAPHSKSRFPYLLIILKFSKESFRWNSHVYQIALPNR